MRRFCSALLVIGFLPIFSQSNVLMTAKRGMHQLLWLKDGAVSKSVELGLVSIYGKADNRLFTVERTDDKVQTSLLSIWNLDSAKQEDVSRHDLWCAAFAEGTLNQVAHFVDKDWIFFVGMTFSPHHTRWYAIRYDLKTKKKAIFTLDIEEQPRISAISRGLLVYLPKSSSFKLLDIEKGSLSDVSITQDLNKLHPSREFLFFDDLGLMVHPKLKNWQHLFAGDLKAKVTLLDFGLRFDQGVVQINRFQISGGTAIAIGSLQAQSQVPMALLFDTMGIQKPRQVLLPGAARAYVPGPDGNHIYYVEPQSGQLVGFNLTTKTSKTLTSSELPQKNLMAVLR